MTGYKTAESVVPLLKRAARSTNVAVKRSLFSNSFTDTIGQQQQQPNLEIAEFEMRIGVVV